MVRSLPQLLGGERLAVLRQLALMPRDLVQVLPRARSGDDVVVLVHGFLASAGVFRPLRARLAAEVDAAHVATFSHAPLVGVRAIARQLGRLVDRIAGDARIAVVGHSLGGIVARWYVQEMGGHARVVRTISLASPFGGVDVPQVLVGADLRAGSVLLKRLRDGAAACSVPHTSVIAGADTVVVGVDRACLGVGEIVVLADRGHKEILFDEEAASVVVTRIRTGRSERPTCGGAAPGNALPRPPTSA